MNMQEFPVCEQEWHDSHLVCSFGITETIAAVIGSAAIGLGAGSAAAGVIGTIGTDALLGAGVGALSSAVTGGKPLIGALTGGLTGGITGGLGPVVSSALGVSPGIGGALVGGVTNAGLSAVTGGNPLTGALTGALGGYALEGLGGGGTGAGTGATPNALPTSVVPAGAEGNFGEFGDVSGSGAGTALAGANPAMSPAVAGGTAVTNASSNAASGGANSGGVLGNLLSGKNSSLLLGGLNALGSLFSKPQVGTWQTPGPTTPAIAQNLGPVFNAPLNPLTTPPRTAVTPTLPGQPMMPGQATMPSQPGSPTQPAPFNTAAVQPVSPWYRYGSMPEQTFFQNNSLAGYGFAHGGALNAEFSTRHGEHHVRGPGSGISDDVPARLSNNEYVLTSDDVARIGNPHNPSSPGANDRGAAKLDHFRKRLAHDTGQRQFPPKRARVAINEGALTRRVGRAA